MKTADNENEPFPFETLGAIVARLVEGSEDHEEQSKREAEKERRARYDTDEHRRYVAHRLREIERFERRARGEKWRR